MPGGHADPAPGTAGQAGGQDEHDAEPEAAGEPGAAADGAGEQVVEVAVGLLAADAGDLGGGGEGDERGDPQELVAHPGGGAGLVAAEAADDLLRRSAPLPATRLARPRRPGVSMKRPAPVAARKPVG